MTQQTRAILFGLGAVLCWSTVATAFKLSLRYLSPEQLVLIASLASWLFLISLLLVNGRFKELFSQPKRAYVMSLLFGALNPILYYFLLFYAYDLLTAQEAQAINYSWAIIMTLLAVPLLGQRVTLIDIVAAVLCYLGVLIIATKGNLLSLKFENLSGVVLALASTVVWSLYWIFNRRDLREPILGLCLNFTFAIPLLILYCLFTNQLSFNSWQGLAGGIYVGIIEMGLAFVLWLFAMKTTKSTAQIANLIFLSPFISLFLIYNILGEPILWTTIVALFLIISGLSLQQLLKKPTQ